MKNKRKGKCNAEVIEKVCILICQGCSWVSISKVTGISRKTLENWRNQVGGFYEKQFDDAVKAALEKRDTGRIKANQFVEAGRHRLKKTVKELRVVDIRSLKSKLKLPPPVMPALRLRKKEIIKYADDFLDLIIDPEFTVNEMRMQCARRIQELSIDVMVKVREEEQEVAANQQAVKNVLTNSGPETERWNFKEQQVHGIDDPLALLLTEIGTSTKQLPSEENVG